MWGSSTWHRPRNFILQLVWPRALLLFIVASALALVYFFDCKTWTYRLRLSSIAVNETFLHGVSPFSFLPFPFFAFVAREITKSVLIPHEQNVERSGTRHTYFPNNAVCLRETLAKITLREVERNGRKCFFQWFLTNVYVEASICNFFPFGVPISSCSTSF